VTDQQRGLLTERADEAADVVGEQVDAVGLEALRLRRQVDATRVGCDDPEARRRERLDLSPPPEPELREAVQQNDQRTIPGLDVVQRLIADFGVPLAKLDPRSGSRLVVGMRTSRVAASSRDYAWRPD